MTDTRDRCVGSLVGLASCDALGTTIEFSRRDTLPPVLDIVGGGPFGLEAGQWTDDTSMALCLATSLVETSQFDLRDQLDRYARWMKEGYLSSTGTCFDIGNQTASAVRAFESSGDLVSGVSDNWSSGNGSLMRLAPVPIAFHRDLDLAEAASAASSLTTHPTTECVQACAACGRLIAGVIQGWDKTQVLEEAAVLAEVVESPALRSILEGDYLEKRREQISSSGYVIHTLEAALWAFMKTEDFRTGAILVVNLGDDSDTVGAVYGQLAGAHYGLSGIPDGWQQRLYDYKLIKRLGEQLCGLGSKLTISEESSRYVE